MKRMLMLIPTFAIADTFEEFYATHPDRDIHRAAAAYEASKPQPPPAPQPDPPPSWSRYEQAMDSAWPLLVDHPAQSNIPPAGLAYRLQDGSNVTFWIVRQGDLLSTQLSSHDANGEPIHRTFDIKTREESTINMQRIVDAKRFTDLSASKTKRAREPKP